MTQAPDPQIFHVKRDTAAEAVALAAASAAVIQGRPVEIVHGYNQKFGADTTVKIWNLEN